MFNKVIGVLTLKYLNTKEKKRKLGLKERFHWVYFFFTFYYYVLYKNLKGKEEGTAHTIFKQDNKSQ